jgi:predicted ATPase
MSYALARHDEILREVVEGYRGFVFKTVGDAFCCAFPTATEALEAALGCQQAIFRERWPEEVGGLRIRMALHTGAADERGGDYFGPPLNRVARLLSAGHGGQVLLSLATQELVRDQLPPGVSLRDLGEKRLKDLARPERVFQLVAPNLPHEFSPLKTLESRRNNLPAQPTPLIGRERELREISNLVRSQDVGLVTLTGPGGTGKTRLALQVAAELVDAFEHGVFFVDLAAATDPDLVFSKIAGALGVAETGARPLAEVVASFLCDKEMLLILDNFEQVVGAASATMEALPCPPVKVLVTSRISLRVYGEHEYAVPPLSVPDPRRLPDLKTLSQYEAVGLFIQRARAAKADFEVTNDNAPAVAEICARLDGLPLAIELAAARIKLLPPKAMLVRLGSRLKLLTGGARDLPERQRTLRGAIEWSYDLLDESEQVLFRRLAVFAGGRTLEAIEAICDAEGDLPVDSLEGVSSLLDKSLLRQEEGAGDEPRFVMLETIHEFAREKLRESGEAEEIKRAHAEYFLALAEEAEPELKGPNQAEWLERLEAEHDNMRAALSWSFDGADPELGLRLAMALWWFWLTRGHVSEGRDWLEAALGRSVGLPTRERAGVLVGAGRLALELGEISHATVLIGEGADLFRTLEDRVGLADATDNLGIAVAYSGDLDRAKALFAESLSLFREANSGWGVGETLNNLGNVAGILEQEDRARSLHEESLAARRKVGDERGIAMSLANLVEPVMSEKDYGRVKVLIEESLAIFRKLGDKGNIAMCLGVLGESSLHEGDLKEATAMCSEALAMLWELGDTYHAYSMLTLLAITASRQDRVERAARLFGAAEALLEGSGISLTGGDLADTRRNLAEARAKMDEAAWEEAFASGRSMSFADTVAYATQEATDLRSQ